MQSQLSIKLDPLSDQSDDVFINLKDKYVNTHVLQKFYNVISIL